MKGTLGAFLKRPLLVVAILSATTLFVPVATSISTSAATSVAPLACNIVPSASVKILSRSIPCVVSTRVGARFTVRFNAGQQWSAPRVSPSLLQVNKISRSSTGPTTVTLRALSVGSTTVTATGHPICAKGVNCPMNVILWTLDVVVSAHGSGSTVSVTVANTGASITLHRGDFLNVQLSGTTMYTWTEPTSSNPTLVRRLSGTSGSTASALFAAVAVGRVMVSAVDNPTCYPACLPPSRLFEVTLTIVK